MAIVLGLSSMAMADAISFEKYRLLENGMSEAEVVLLAGEPDRETQIKSHKSVTGKIWYYMPKTRSGWVTIITFDSNGRVLSIERNKL